MKTLSSFELSQISGGFNMITYTNAAENGAYTGLTIATLAMFSSVSSVVTFPAAIAYGAAFGVACEAAAQTAYALDYAFFDSSYQV